MRPKARATAWSRPRQGPHGREQAGDDDLAADPHVAARTCREADGSQSAGQGCKLHGDSSRTGGGPATNTTPTRLAGVGLKGVGATGLRRRAPYLGRQASAFLAIAQGTIASGRYLEWARPSIALRGKSSGGRAPLPILREQARYRMCHGVAVSLAVPGARAGFASRRQPSTQSERTRPERSRACLARGGRQAATDEPPTRVPTLVVKI